MQKMNRKIDYATPKGIEKLCWPEGKSIPMFDFDFRIESNHASSVRVHKYPFSTWAFTIWQFLFYMIVALA